MAVLSMLLCLFSSQVSIVKPPSSSSSSSLLSLFSLWSAIVNSHHPCSVVAAIIGARHLGTSGTAPLPKRNSKHPLRISSLHQRCEDITLFPQSYFIRTLFFLKS
ncbi:hypothetical protein RIF29_20784 [Crotalaria pallida]|uniref:Secreted protein n=1 Tax=Crotalaria pallida TaxID=3830 RepID=A0AAN9F1Q6_CROPI